MIPCHTKQALTGLLFLSMPVMSVAQTSACDVPVADQGNCSSAVAIDASSLQGKNVHLILTIGNSHNIGRANAASGDTFDQKVLQWTQCDTIARPFGVQKAMLDHIDPSRSGTGKLSPDLTFSEDYLAANTGVDYLLFVPSAKGGTGFVNPDDEDDWSGNWSARQEDLTAAEPCSRLDEAVTRYNTVTALLNNAQANVTHAGTLFHNANPDYNPSDIRWTGPDADSAVWDHHQQQIDSFIDYLRSNLSGYTASTPIVIGGGMLEHQFDGRPTNDALFQANLNGAHKRRNKVGTYDPIHYRDQDFMAGKLDQDDLPIDNSDAFHADTQGERSKGHLRFRAWQRAVANTNHLSPFSNLSFFDDLIAYWDFRSGTPLDLTDNGNHLIRYREDSGSIRPPLYRFDSALDELVWRRPATSTYRFHQLPMALPASYTIALYVKFSEFNSPMALLQQAGGLVNRQHRFQYSLQHDEIQAGHGSNRDTVSFPGSALTSNQYYLLTLSFDATTQQMALGLNGTLMSTASNVASHNSASGSFLGGATSSGANPLVGSMAFAMVAERALTALEICQLWQETWSLGGHNVASAPHCDG